MTSVPPVNSISSLFSTDSGTQNAAANSTSLTLNTDAPAVPGSGMQGLIDLFAKKPQGAGSGQTANLWLSHVVIPQLDSTLDDDN
jgi:hypothetical protein